ETPARLCSCSYRIPHKPPQLRRTIPRPFLDLSVLVEHRLTINELAPVGAVDLGECALNVHAFHVCAADCGDDLVAEGVEVFCSAGRCDTVDAALEAVSQEGQGVDSGISVFPEVWASGHRLQHLGDLFQMASSLDGSVLACWLRHCGLEPLFCVLDGHFSPSVLYLSAAILATSRLPIIMAGLIPSSSAFSSASFSLSASLSTARIS